MIGREEVIVKVAWVKKDSDECNVHIINMYLDEMEHCNIMDVYNDNTYWLFIDTAKAPLDELLEPQDLLEIMQMLEEEIDGNYNTEPYIRVKFDGGKYLVVDGEGNVVGEHTLVNKDLSPIMEFGMYDGTPYFIPNYYSTITYSVITD